MTSLSTNASDALLLLVQAVAGFVRDLSEVAANHPILTCQCFLFASVVVIMRSGRRA